MSSPTRDAIALSILQFGDDNEAVDLVLAGWRGLDATPLVMQLAGLVGCYADHATSGHGREDLEHLALLAAADPRCTT